MKPAIGALCRLARGYSGLRLAFPPTRLSRSSPGRQRHVVLHIADHRKLPRDFAQIVLDPFLGSGTTAAIAKKLGRNYLGIELNGDYVRLAEDRLTRINPTFSRKLG